jgi:hypothetical protein
VKYRKRYYNQSMEGMDIDSREEFMGGLEEAFL